MSGGGGELGPTVSVCGAFFFHVHGKTVQDCGRLWKTRQPRIPQTQLQNPLQAPVARNPLIGGLLVSCPKNGG